MNETLTRHGNGVYHVPGASCVICALIAERVELREALAWALDLLDMYDERMVQLGDPEEMVYSPTHLAGKAKARAALFPHESLVSMAIDAAANDEETQRWVAALSPLSEREGTKK